jgi:hypothetical protein
MRLWVRDWTGIQYGKKTEGRLSERGYVGSVSVGSRQESGDLAVWGCIEALNIGLAMCGGGDADFLSVS